MKACFGTIYPDLLQINFGKDCVGKVFRFNVDTLGAGHRAVHFESNNTEWEQCQQCESYRSCIDFSNAKLHMQRVVNAI
jgi:sulfatase maturation enzyme AslB (radical SAM superfamily)